MNGILLEFAGGDDAIGFRKVVLVRNHPWIMFFRGVWALATRYAAEFGGDWGKYAGGRATMQAPRANRGRSWVLIINRSLPK